MSYVIGMDIGGTSSRMKIVKEGTTIKEHTGVGCTLSTSGYEIAEGCYRSAVLPVLEELGLDPKDCGGLCAAVSGVDSPDLERQCRDIFAGMGFAEDNLHIYNDCAVFLEAFDTPALVVVAGTGSIAFGKTRSGRMVRCGGWGHILSDEGSAMYMGLRVLHAVGNHMDGRLNCPVLFEEFRKQSEIDSVAALDTYMNNNIMEKPQIAKYAVLAETAANLGDEAAEKILEECAEALFGLVRDTWGKMKTDAQRVGGGSVVQENVGQGGAAQDDAAQDGSLPDTELPCELILWGSVLTKNRRVEEWIRRKCGQEFPFMRISFPEKSALDLAAELAGRKEKGRA